MLRKAIKYEWRASARRMLPLYLAMLALSVVSHFAQKYLDAGSDIRIINTLSVITMILFFVGLSVISISAIVLTVQRFYRSFFSDEGYLTMTLPLSSHKLILSRLIVSVIWYALSFFACVLSVFIIIAGGKDWSLFPGQLAKLFSSLWEARHRVDSYATMCFGTLRTELPSIVRVVAYSSSPTPRPMRLPTSGTVRTSAKQSSIARTHLSPWSATA